MYDRSKRVLIISDQATPPELNNTLSTQGYESKVANSAREGLELFEVEQFDHVVLNLGGQDSGLMGLIRCTREKSPASSLVVVADGGGVTNPLEALQAGADDFLIPPFSVSELVARLEAASLRSDRNQNRLEVGPIRMDLTRRQVSRDERSIQLTPTEFRILEILLRNHGRVVTRKMLCEFLWNPEWEGVTNVIEVHINRLRSKLNQDGAPQMIHTVRGSGYVLRANGTTSPRLATAEHA